MPRPTGPALPASRQSGGASTLWDALQPSSRELESASNANFGFGPIVCAGIGIYGHLWTFDDLVKFQFCSFARIFVRGNHKQIHGAKPWGGTLRTTLSCHMCGRPLFASPSPSVRGRGGKFTTEHTERIRVWILRVPGVRPGEYPGCPAPPKAWMPVSSTGMTDGVCPKWSASWPGPPDRLRRSAARIGSTLPRSVPTF